MIDMDKSMLRSKTAWVATIMLIVFILKTYFKVEIPEIDKLIELVLLCGVSWGIFNNK
jgi:hypothetical protein